MRIQAGWNIRKGQAPWLPDLGAELLAFPVGRHDDQCDSISQALLDPGVRRLMIDWK
jgi:predicted phage terminase large subunit-like protein